MWRSLLTGSRTPGKGTPVPGTLTMQLSHPTTSAVLTELFAVVSPQRKLAPCPGPTKVAGATPYCPAKFMNPVVLSRWVAVLIDPLEASWVPPFQFSCQYRLWIRGADRTAPV